MIRSLICLAVLFAVGIFMGVKGGESANELLAKSAIAASIDIYTDKADEPKWKHILGLVCSFEGRMHLGPSTYTPSQVADFIFKIAQSTISDPSNPNDIREHLGMTVEKIIGQIAAKWGNCNEEMRLKGGKTVMDKIFAKMRSELSHPFFVEKIKELELENAHFPSEAMRIGFFYYRFYVALIMDVLTAKNRKYVTWLNELLEQLHVYSWPWNKAPFKFWKWNPILANNVWVKMLAEGPHQPELCQLMKKEGKFGNGIRNEEGNGRNDGVEMLNMQQQQQQMMLNNAILMNNNIV